MVRGAGSRIWDHEGRQYVDCVLGSGALLLGHAHPKVIAAVTDQMEKGTTYYALSPPVLELAERIVHHVPSAEQVQFCSSGGEAVNYALRLARAATGRHTILKFEGGFHGFSDYAQMSWGPASPSRFPQPQPDSAGIPPELEQRVLVAPFNNLGETTRIVSAYGDRLAAVLVEPLQRAIPPADGFLPGLREVCDRYGIVLVFDEVVTGFRLGLGGAQGHYGVLPDLTCLGKTIGGGFPMGAVTGPRSIMQLAAHRRPAPDSIFMSGTLNGNPVSSAAGLATLRVLEGPGVYRRLFAIGDWLRGRLAEAFRRRRIPAQVIGDGPVVQIVLTDRRVIDYEVTLQADHATLARLASQVVEKGVFIAGEKMYLSLAHSDQDLERIADAWRTAEEG